MGKINAQFVAGGCLLLFSLAFLREAMKYNYSGSLGLGPGFFPVWLCSILTVLSLVYIGVNLKNKAKLKNIIPSTLAARNILLILSSMVGFVILLNYLGFILSSTLFLMVLFYGSYKWYIGIGVSLAVSLFLFWLFQIMLSIQLPGFDLF